MCVIIPDMFKMIGSVMVIFFGVVLVYFFLTIAGSLFGSLAPSLTNADSGPAGLGGSGSGLSSIDFSLFDKGGKGRSYITQGYGDTAYAYLYVGHWHNGIDIAAQYGAPIYSPATGKVLATGDQDNYCPGKGFGKFVALEDDKNNIVLWFAHLSTISVLPGDTINKGDEIGAVGTTGLETGPHLHFSIFLLDGFTMENKNGCGPDANGRDVNPFNYLGTTYR